MVKLFSKNSNLCDHNSPTLQTDRRTDRQTTCDRNTALCTKVHRAVKIKIMEGTGSKMRWHASHIAGIPGILKDFTEHGKLREFRASSGKSCKKQNIFCSLLKYSSKAAVDFKWTVLFISAMVKVMEWPIYRRLWVIITIACCCDNPWKSKFMALEKPVELGEFFSATTEPPWMSSTSGPSANPCI